MTAPEFTPAEASRPVSPVLDAATIGRAVIDPVIASELAGRFDAELITTTADVALTHLLVATDEALPTATENVHNFLLSKTSTDPVVHMHAVDSLGSMTGSSVENMTDAVMNSTIAPKTPNRPFTDEESAVVDAALEIAASRTSGPKPRIETKGIDADTALRIASDTSLLLSGVGDDSKIYSDAARDLLARRRAQSGDQNKGPDTVVGHLRGHARRVRVARALHVMAGHLRTPHLGT